MPCPSVQSATDLRCRQRGILDEPYPRGFKSSGVFEAEGHEDVVPLAFEVVFCDRSRRSKLVEVVEPGHDLGLVDLFGALLVTALLASFVLGRLAVVALSGDASLVCALTHLDLSSVVPPTPWSRAVGLLMAWACACSLDTPVLGKGNRAAEAFRSRGEARSGTTRVSRLTWRRIWLRDGVGRESAIRKLRTFKSTSPVRAGAPTCTSRAQP